MDTQRERVYDILSDFADAAHREGRVYLDAAVDQVMAALTEPQGCEGCVAEHDAGDCMCSRYFADHYTPKEGDTNE